jgi:hypothetical protein
VIARAFEDDAVAAASEYGQGGGVVFRSDVEAFLSPEAVDAVTVGGRRELAPAVGLSYVAFVDVSGGSQDSYTLAIAHATADGVAVLDALRETRPPFSPAEVTGDYARLLRAYHVSQVTGDKYGGEFPVELYAKAGIEYLASERTKSDVYREFLPIANARRCELLDEPRLRAQLVGLERRVARGGKDSIDHGPAGHDDVANAAAGAVVLAVGGGASWERWIQAAREGVLTGPIGPPAGAAPPPASSRTIIRAGDRAPAQTRCACGALFDVRDQITACPNCGAALPTGRASS